MTGLGQLMCLKSKRIFKEVRTQRSVEYQTGKTSRFGTAEQRKQGVCADFDYKFNARRSGGGRWGDFRHVFFERFRLFGDDVI